jgi:predicted phage terminase large subunit-like protein
MLVPSLEQIDAELARRSLREFMQQAWPVLEPQTPFVGNWHLDAVSEHLQACSRGEIEKLIINVPPGHCKSMSVCIFWPAWEWATKPHLRWIFASYAAHLSVRDSIKTRTLINSEWYQKAYGHRYQLAKTNEQLITNDKLGFRYATSIGGVGTGERVHRAINDDLLNATDARSEAMRQQATDHLQAMSTRGIPSEPFIQVLIMQRLDERDPTAWAQEQGGWEELILPAEFEIARRAKTKIGFQDPRQVDGELLWPALFPLDKIQELKKALGPYGAASQLQQRPAPIDGGLIKIEWFKDYVNLPHILYKVQSWDTAFKVKQENDYSVCTTWGVGVDGCFYLLHRYKGKVEFPELKKVMLELFLMHNPITILVEDKASGQSLIQEMQRPQIDPQNAQRRIKLPIRAVKADIDKIARVNACTATIETNVYVKKTESWHGDYTSNMAVFPNGAHDDDVDSTTHALIWLTSNRPRPPQAVTVGVLGR